MAQVAAELGVGVGNTAYTPTGVHGMALGQQYMQAGAHYSSPVAGQSSGGSLAQIPTGYPAAGYPHLAHTPSPGQQQRAWGTPPGHQQSSGEGPGNLSRASAPPDAGSGSFALSAGVQARASPTAAAGAAGSPVADGSFTQLQDEEEVLLQVCRGPASG
jgi:hypothetical protein